MFVRSWLTQKIVAYLTRTVPDYERRTANDLRALKARIRPADVLLVQGEQRVSAIIRYLTQSSWSHAALYIGDALLRDGGEPAEEARAAFGDEAAHLLIEALPQGVVATPIANYAHLNLRICRPHRLRREDADRVLAAGLKTLGWRYDLRNILDLARYLIPVRFVPQRFREAALHFGSGQPTEVICSSHLGHLFHGVGFPVIPTVVEMPDAVRPRRRLRERVLGHRSREYTGLFRMRHPTLMTPRDFDLSPYFDIIKFNAPDGDRFDYRKIHWIPDEAAQQAIEAVDAPAPEPGPDDGDGAARASIETGNSGS